MSTPRTIPRWPSTSSQTAPLAQPCTFPFSGRTAPNRFLKAATSEHLATFDHGVGVGVDDRGIPTPELIRLYERLGRGGWGQIVTGNIMISLTDMEGPGNAIIPFNAPFSGPRFEAFKALAAAAKIGWEEEDPDSDSHEKMKQKKRSLIVAQISHPGRQAQEHLQPHPISASAVQLVKPAMGKFGVPRAATEEDIRGVIASFAHAAVYLAEAGFDGIQLHGAHGYLIAQFLSLATNKRPSTDLYGGSISNRMRLVLEIGAAIKDKLRNRSNSGDKKENFILGIKINSVEFQDNGFTPSEATTLCQALEDAGFDYVETSGGSYEDEDLGFVHKRESTRKRESYFIEFAERISRAVEGRIKVYTTGGFKTVGAMLDALEAVDGVGVGRAACQEPDFARLVLEGRITGAMKLAIPDSQIMSQLGAMTYLIREMSRGEEPSDLTDPEVVKRVLTELSQQHQQKEGEKVW